MKVKPQKLPAVLGLITAFSLWTGVSVPLIADERAPKEEQVAAGAVAYQYVGRVNLATGVVYGYFTQIAGIPATTSLFAGTPSESTALFTFRADIRFTPLPGNGDLGGGQFSVMPIVVSPGSFSIYFNQAPSRNWNDPNSFSTGQAIGVFSRTLDQQTIIGPISINAATAILQSSAKILLGPISFDLGRLVRYGVTNFTTVNNVPLAGGAFAFGGYGIALGK